MKKILYFIIAFIIMNIIALSAKDKIRVGVYDSRAIAICYFRSDDFTKQMREIMMEYKKAKEKGDSVKAKEFEEKGKLLQRIAHDKGFGKGSVAEILDKYKTGIEKIAEAEKIDIIMSKWELNYFSDNIEIIDISILMMDLFKADENVKKMAKELEKNEPVKDAFFLDIGK